MTSVEAIKASGVRVAVLSGGNSSEREVSLVSGKSVAKALESLGLPCDLMDLKQNLLPGSSLDRDKHLVLPIIHGSYGEDGCLSAELDAGGYAYAGCDQASSVLCFDKLTSKLIAGRLDMEIAADRILTSSKPPVFDDLAAALGLPFILKPRRDGSSMGLHLVREEKDLLMASDDLKHTEYLAESYLEGIDLTVGILDGEPLGVVGVHPEGGLYDYEHKYTSGMSRYDVPAVIDESLHDRLMEQSRMIFHTLGCRDLARVDFRLAPSGKCIFLEINTLPGMTPTSLLPKTASCQGISFEELVLRWTGLAFTRFKERGAL